MDYFTQRCSARLTAGRSKKSSKQSSNRSQDDLHTRQATPLQNKISFWKFNSNEIDRAEEYLPEDYNNEDFKLLISKYMSIQKNQYGKKERQFYGMISKLQTTFGSSESNVFVYYAMQLNYFQKPRIIANILNFYEDFKKTPKISFHFIEQELQVDFENLFILLLYTLIF